MMVTQAVERQEEQRAGIKKPVLFILIFTVLLDFLGFTMVLPYLYLYAQSIGASVFAYGGIVAVYALMQLVCTPLFGRLSDLYGRRKILIVTLVGSGLSYLLFGFSNDLWLLFLSRALNGAFSSTYSVAQAYVCDVTRTDTRLKYLGFLAGAYGLGYVIGPVVGGLLSESLGYAAPAFLASIFAIANALVAYRKFPEVGRRIPSALRTDSSPIPPMTKIAKEQILLLGINFISTLVFVALLVVVPPWLHEVFQFGTLTTGIILSYAGGLSIATVVLVVPLISKRISSLTMLAVGFAVIAAGYLGLGYVNTSSPWSVAVVVALAGLLSIGFSITGPSISSLISVTSPSGEQGKAMGVAKSSASAAQVIAPSIATFFLAFGATSGSTGFVFVVCMLISVVALPMVFLLRRPSYLGTWEKILIAKKTPGKMMTEQQEIIRVPGRK